MLVNGIKFQIKIKNRLTNIPEVQEHFQLFAQHHKVEKKATQKICIVIDELLSNIISYAFQKDDKHHDIDVKVEFAEGHGRLFVTISDDGIPFNPIEEEAPDTTLPVEDRSIGGLGIMLVRKLSDKLTYKRDLNRNVVTFMMSLNKCVKQCE